MSEEHWTKDTPLTWTAWGVRALLMVLFGVWAWWLDNADVAIGVLACGYVVWMGARLWRRWRAA